jgi:hypothetical protein
MTQNQFATLNTPKYRWAKGNYPPPLIIAYRPGYYAMRITTLHSMIIANGNAAYHRLAMYRIFNHGVPDGDDISCGNDSRYFPCRIGWDQCSDAALRQSFHCYMDSCSTADRESFSSGYN